jgi:hypothetical protein
MQLRFSLISCICVLSCFLVSAQLNISISKIGSNFTRYNTSDNGLRTSTNDLSGYNLQNKIVSCTDTILFSYGLKGKFFLGCNGFIFGYGYYMLQKSNNDMYNFLSKADTSVLIDSTQKKQNFARHSFGFGFYHQGDLWEGQRYSRLGFKWQNMLWYLYSYGNRETSFTTYYQKDILGNLLQPNKIYDDSFNARYLNAVTLSTSLNLFLARRYKSVELQVGLLPTISLLYIFGKPFSNFSRKIYYSNAPNDVQLIYAKDETKIGNNLGIATTLQTTLSVVYYFKRK